MLANRLIKIRLDVMSTRHFLVMFGTGLAIMVIAMIVGGTGPQLYISRPAGTPGVGVPLADAAQQCTVRPDGTSLVPIVLRCWSHRFEFSSRFIQYFDVRLHPNLLAGLADQQRTLPLQVTWLGNRAGTAAWDEIFTGNVTRPVRCSGRSCSPIVLFRTSAVAYTNYWLQVNIAAGSDASTYLGTADFSFRYRNPDFSIFELGFKATWMSVSVIVAITYIALTACDCSARGISALMCLGCKRGSSPLNFQRQEGLNWLYALLVGLILFNEPLLWATYYAPAAAIKFVSVAMQLTFIALLLCYWLVEFGLVKANPQSAPTVTCARFYMPKAIAMALYWILALSVYGYVLFQMARDPLYDWTALNSAPLFLVALGVVLAALYLIYLLWLILRSCTVIRTFKPGERYLFGLHLVVLVATALGIGIGVLYSFDVTDAFSFMFFNALFNVYCYSLAYLYTPLLYEVVPGGDGSDFGRGVGGTSVLSASDDGDGDGGGDGAGGGGGIGIDDAADTMALSTNVAVDDSLVPTAPVSPTGATADAAVARAMTQAVAVAGHEADIADDAAHGGHGIDDVGEVEMVSLPVASTTGIAAAAAMPATTAPPPTAAGGSPADVVVEDLEHISGSAVGGDGRGGGSSSTKDGTLTGGEVRGSEGAS